MKAIDFIVDDVVKSRRARTTTIGMGFMLTLISAGIGLGARGDFVEALRWSNLIPAAAMLGGIITLPLLRNGNWDRKRVGILVLILIFAVLSFIQPQTSASLAKFADPEDFWPENFHCLVLGWIVSFICSTVISALTATALPSPNFRWQLVFAALSGMCGVSALTFHCMGPLASHTLLAHWGQSLLVFPVALAQFRLWHHWLMRQIFPHRADGDTLRKLSKIDR